MLCTVHVHFWLLAGYTEYGIRTKQRSTIIIRMYLHNNKYFMFFFSLRLKFDLRVKQLILCFWTIFFFFLFVFENFSLVTAEYNYIEQITKNKRNEKCAMWCFFDQIANSTVHSFSSIRRGSFGFSARLYSVLRRILYVPSYHTQCGRRWLCHSHASTEPVM